MFQLKNTQQIILGIISVGYSKFLFWSFDDPEGANLLVVLGLAFILYGVSLSAYMFNKLNSDRKKFLLALCIQVLVATTFYIYLN